MFFPIKGYALSSNFAIIINYAHPSVSSSSHLVIKEVISQLVKYSNSEGTEYGILTNGIVWMLVRTFEKGTKLSERKVWKTDIENEEMPKIVRKLMTISKTNIERIEDLVKKNQILDEIWQSLLDKPEEIVMGLSLVVEPIISQNYSNYQFENS